MGRYYYGDIEGKFWFGVQSSDAADRFGVTGYEPNYICYSFTEDDLPSVLEEISNIEQSLALHLPRIEMYFDQNSSYTIERLAEFLGVDISSASRALSDYADLKLGYQIRDSIQTTGQCYFEAEC